MTQPINTEIFEGHVAHIMERDRLGQFHDSFEEVRIAMYYILVAIKNRDVPPDQWDNRFDYEMWDLVRISTRKCAEHAFKSPVGVNVVDTMSVSRKIMQNERGRWSYMNDTDLSRRLWKITREDKLEAFLMLAKENDSPDWLVGQALARAEQLDMVSLVAKYKDRAFSERRPKAKWKKSGTKSQKNSEKIHERKIRI